MPGFEFGITVTIPYSTLRNVARDQLLDRDLEVRDGVQIRIHDLDLRPRDERVEVALDFAFTQMKNLPLKPEGQLVLVGHPSYDADERRLSIAGLELDVETEHLLLKMADKLLHRPLLNRLEKALDFDLDEPLARAAENLRDVPFGDRGHIRCEFTQLVPRHIGTNTDGLEVSIDVVGRGEVDLNLDLGLAPGESRAAE